MEELLSILSSQLLSNLLAIVMVIFVVYELWDKKVNPKQEEKKRRSKEKKEEYLKQLKSVREQLIKIYNEIILKNNFNEKIYISRVPEVVGEKIDNYINSFLEQCSLISDVYEGCYCIVKSNIESNSKSWLPETIKLNPIQGMISNRELINQFLNDINLNDTWMKDNHLDTYHYILSHLDEKEKGIKIDEFYRSLNHTIKNDKLILRYKSEKNKLIASYKILLNGLELEISKE